MGLTEPAELRRSPDHTGQERVRVRDRVGAGIGGLAAALCLAAAGFSDVTIYERSSALHEVGAGVQISPNGSRILHGLGLGDALGRGRPCAPDAATCAAGRTGRCCRAARSATTVVGEYGFPYYHVHRADLSRVLAARVPAGRISLGRRLVRLDPLAGGDTGAVLRFADGSTTVADVVVGADGDPLRRARGAVRSRRRRASPATRHGGAWCRRNGSPTSSCPSPAPW